MVHRRPHFVKLEQLEERQMLAANLQVIHNSPYEAAQVVDVYVNEALAIDNFAFRDATGFLELASGTPLQIDIKGADSTATSPSVFSANLTLEDGRNYIAVAAGDPTGAEGQPAFGLSVSDMGRPAAEDASNVEFAVFHGSPDAPTVDVVGRDIGLLVDDLAFPNYSDSYLSVPPASYTIDITPADDNDLVVASFEADLTAAAGGSLVVAASGFLAPASETDPAFGLLAVFADGTTALLPSVDVPSAQLQVIHNSPYAGAEAVDVYVNDALLLDDFAYQDATPFVEVPANQSLKLDVTAASAMDNSDPVFSTEVVLKSTDYVAIAVGNPAESSLSSAFQLALTDIGRPTPAVQENVEFLVFHGSPDAPSVDVVGQGIGVLVDDLPFAAFADDYLSVAPDAYLLDITPANDNDTVVVSFHADLSSAGGQSVIVAASGFLNPTADDPAFSLLAAFADGTTALIPRNLPAAVLPGDADGNGEFNQIDLTIVLQAGKYLSGEEAKFSEGDWNNDGVFNQADIIEALAKNSFVHATNAADAALMEM